MTSTPPYRDKARQAYTNSPVTSGGSNSGHNPFTTGSNVHPNFMPVKLGTKGAETRIPKPPKQPEKPLMPYMRYSRKVWDQVKAQNQDLKLWQIGKVIGQMWRDLSELEKQEFVDCYEAEKLQYNENMRLYHNSPAYQSFLKDKQKAEAMIEEEERSRARLSKSEPRVTIQPADDEEDGSEVFSIKHVAAARYYRNHRLIAEIFNDTLVPDLRSIVTANKLNMLKKQMQSLTAHHAKLENELREVEEKFEAKKRRLAEMSNDFQRSLKDLCDKRPRFTDEQFEQMVARAKEELQRSMQKQKAGTPAEQMKRDAEKGTTASEAGDAAMSVAATIAEEDPAAASADERTGGQPEQMVSCATGSQAQHSQLGGDSHKVDGATARSQQDGPTSRNGHAEHLPKGAPEADSCVSRQESSGSEGTGVSKEEEPMNEEIKGESSADEGSDEDYRSSAMEDEGDDAM